MIVSAVSGEGIEELLAKVLEKFNNKSEIKKEVLSMDEGKRLAYFYEKHQVIERVDDVKNGKIYLTVKYNKNI